jgi:hypothetical protein
MGDSGFFEHLAVGDVAVFEVKAFSRQLRMQNSAVEATPLSVLHQKFENSLANSFTAPLAKHRHSPYLDVITMGDNPPASNRRGSVQSKRMNRPRVVGIQLDFFRDVLFFDEHCPPDGPCLLHPGRPVDFYEFYLGTHAPPK